MFTVSNAFAQTAYGLGTGWHSRGADSQPHGPLPEPRARSDHAGNASWGTPQTSLRRAECAPLEGSLVRLPRNKFPASPRTQRRDVGEGRAPGFSAQYEAREAFQLCLMVMVGWIFAKMATVTPLPMSPLW